MMKFSPDLAVDSHAVGDFTQGGGFPLTTMTKYTHPYNYGPYLLFSTGERATGSAYSDRMLSRDYDKYHAAKKQPGCGRGDSFSGATAHQIEDFLRAYYNEPNLRLVRAEEHCNQANGYPIWYFQWIA